MTDDELRRVAIRKGVDRLNGELSQMWGEVASVFGEDSAPMWKLYSAKSSCDIVAMEQTLVWLRKELQKPREVAELDAALERLEVRSAAAFGTSSRQSATIKAARATAVAGEMREVLAAIRGELGRHSLPPSTRVPARAAGRPSRAMHRGAVRSRCLQGIGSSTGIRRGRHLTRRRGRSRRPRRAGAHPEGAGVSSRSMCIT